jgi:gas vesicle protein
MNERSAVLLGAAVGAVAGGLAGYLFLTERGRALRDDLQPALGDMLRNVSALRDTVERARSAASEGWRAISEAAGEGSAWSRARQQAPF